MSELEAFDLYCPYCQAKVLRAISYQGVTPAAGDYFCCPCGEVSVLSNRSMFVRAWHVRRPTRAERLVIHTHAEAQAMMEKLRDHDRRGLSVLQNPS